MKTKYIVMAIVAAILALVLGIVLLQAFPVDALGNTWLGTSSAKSGYYRSESCRTYPLFAHQKVSDNTEEQDYEICGLPNIEEELPTVPAVNHRENDEQISVVTFTQVPDDSVSQEILTDADETEDQSSDDEVAGEDDQNSGGDSTGGDTGGGAEKPEKVHVDSGRGNGSTDIDGDGVDDDPGNSEGHNHGGD